jgi:predicted nucleotidyltransferase
MEGPFEVLSQIARVFESLGVAYVVVGSFASSTRGVYRATADIDIVTDLKSSQVEPLVAALRETFYIDDLAARRAVARHGSFNVIHYDAAFKVGVFVPADDDDLSRQQLARRQREQIAPNVPQEIYVATAEDTILAKLRWYRAGGSISRTQLNDVLGIVGTQGSSLDVAYLRERAEKSGVADLLEQVLNAAGG